MQENFLPKSVRILSDNSCEVIFVSLFIVNKWNMNTIILVISKKHHLSFSFIRNMFLSNRSSAKLFLILEVGVRWKCSSFSFSWKWQELFFYHSIMDYGALPSGILEYFQLTAICKHYSRASNLNFCGTIQTLFVMDYGALPSGILEYFQLTIEGNMQTLFQIKQLELLWNYSDVIHLGSGIVEFFQLAIKGNVQTLF